MKNYNEIITKAKDFPQLSEDIKEINEMKTKKYNIKNNIEALKIKLLKLLKTNDR